MLAPVLVTLGLGFSLGMKHATEADHLAAVSAIVSERRSIRDAVTVGALWGLGHTASLAAAGVLVIVLGVALPARLADYLELAVAAMIIGLGSRILYRALRGFRSVHVHTHSHGGRPHSHIHFHDEQDAHATIGTHGEGHTAFAGWRPVIVGMVHGMAGSAALTLLVLTDIVHSGSRTLGMIYLIVFGSGSVGGMMIVSGLIGLPFAAGLPTSQRGLSLLRLASGAFSTVFGIFYAWNIMQRI